MRNLADIDAQSILHPATHADEFSRSGSKIIQSGQGIYVRDSSGKQLIDAVAGLWCVNVGYGREELAEAMHKAALELGYYHTFSGMSNEPQIALAERLLDKAPEGLSKVFFGSGGSDGNDSLIKIIWYINNIRNKPAKKKIISRWQAYHGTSLGTASLTGLPSFHSDFDLPLENILHTESPDFYRYGLEGETELQFSLRRAQQLEDLIVAQGEDTVAAFIAEPVLGAGGVVTPPEGYFEAIQAVLKRHDILFIVDEVVCGYGRLGKWFGSEVYDLKPDMMTTAKALTSGYFPYSASFVSDEIWQTVKQGSVKNGNFAHGYTYAGHPVGAAVAMANLDIIDDENLVENASSVGTYFHQQLRQRFAQDSFVGEVRGTGMIAAVQFVKDKTDRQFFDKSSKISAKIAAQCYQNGLIARPLPTLDSMAFSPPLICTTSDIDDIVDIFETSVRAVMAKEL
jgi:L-2,4-diaminobutyrate transaminase